MKSIDFLLASGCSFTDGGGLESPTLMREFGYETNDNEEAEFGLKEKLKWTRLIANHYNCEVKNISLAGNSNDNIRRSLVEYIESNKEYLSLFKNKVCIVQTSFSHRITHKLNNNMYSFNPHDAPTFENGDKLQDWYKTFLSLIYDKDEFIRYHYLDLLCLISYLKENKFTPYLIFFDTEYEPYSSKFDETIMFDGKYFNAFVSDEKERFCDKIEWTKDAHYTPRGNELIAKKIIDYIENNY